MAVAVDAAERVSLAAVVTALAGAGRCWRLRRLAAAWRRWSNGHRERVLAALQQRRGEEQGELEKLRAALRAAEANHLGDMAARAAAHKREMRGATKEIEQLQHAAQQSGGGGASGAAQLTLTMHKVQAEMYRHFVSQALEGFGGRGVLALRGDETGAMAAPVVEGEEEEDGAVLLTYSSVPACKKVRGCSCCRRRCHHCQNRHCPTRY